MNEIEFIPHQQLPEITEEAILEFEAELGKALPNDYRQYLRLHNGSLPVNHDYWMPGESNWIETVFEMYSISPRGHPQSLRNFIYDDYGIPSGWLPIADSGYGDYTVISLSVEDFGSIYYLFHETHGFDPSEKERGVYKLASSFLEWIQVMEDLSAYD
ncbi:MAG: SMI1/KNR4 family protein [Chloroflexi bacterium]|nr:SMI1/KNR4 family protein [Chloroflexota bacterium]